MDPYKVLNLSRDATKEDIRKAYKKLAFKYHPDRNLNNAEEASEKFKEIHEAYVKLENGEYSSENGYKFNMNINELFDKMKNTGLNESLKVFSSSSSIEANSSSSWAHIAMLLKPCPSFCLLSSSANCTSIKLFKPCK